MNFRMAIPVFFLRFFLIYIVGINILHLDPLPKFLIISIGLVCHQYLFKWLNIRILQKPGEVSTRIKLNPYPLGHIFLFSGALAVGYGVSAWDKLFIVAGVALLWFADNLFTEVAPTTPNQAVQNINPLHRYLFALLRNLIRGAQRSIGIVPYKVVPDANGMASLGDLARQPWSFEAYCSRDYAYDPKRNSGIHVVISKSDFTVIQNSLDPRDGPGIKKLTSAIDVARHFTSFQMTVAVNMSMAREENYEPIKGRYSSEQLNRFVELLGKHRELLEKELNTYLSSRKVRLINYLIKILSKAA